MEIERDARTVFANQIPPKASDKELQDFFEKAGPVRELSVIRDKNTGRSKGIAYVEYEFLFFYFFFLCLYFALTNENSDKASVQVALAMSGQIEFMRHRIVIQVPILFSLDILNYQRD